MFKEYLFDLVDYINSLLNNYNAHLSIIMCDFKQIYIFKNYEIKKMYNYTNLR